jgi:hypothetical protein
MARALAITAASKAASVNTVDMTVAKLRYAVRRRCDLCSDRVDIGECTCQMRCLSRRCAGPEDIPAGADEASIP